MNATSIEATIPQMARPKILNGDISRQFYRARRLPKLIGTVGVARTAKAIYNGMVGNNNSSPMVMRRDNELHFPLHLTDTFSDVWSYAEVHNGRTYDLPKALDPKINGKPIVDIGAYIGISATYFASRYSNSEVLAFEPHPRNYQLLALNAKPYGGRIQPVHAAVAAENTPIGMIAHGALQSDYMVNAFVPESISAPSYGLSIASRTPSDILAMLGGVDEIGMLKVDIEGAEYPLFQSPAIDPLLQRTGILLVESHEKFVPGSEDVVHEAAIRNGMHLFPFNSHTAMYARS
jgi:FkbM family methyltransferase